MAVRLRERNFRPILKVRVYTISQKENFSCRHPQTKARKYTTDRYFYYVVNAGSKVIGLRTIVHVRCILSHSGSVLSRDPQLYNPLFD